MLVWCCTLTHSNHACIPTALTFGTRSRTRSAGGSGAASLPMAQVGLATRGGGGHWMVLRPGARAGRITLRQRPAPTVASDLSMLCARRALPRSLPLLPVCRARVLTLSCARPGPAGAGQDGETLSPEHRWPMMRAAAHSPQASCRGTFAHHIPSPSPRPSYPLTPPPHLIARCRV